MSDFSGCRLEKDGTTIIYFAPASTITPSFKNDLFDEDRPSDRGTIVRDKNMWHHEVSVQGDFVHSSELPDDHAAALSGLDMGSKDNITARDQLNRLVEYSLETGGNLDLYDFGDTYTKTDMDTVSYASGIFPSVYVGEIQSPRGGGQSRIAYTVKFTVGVES